jgi:hypothetical protein
MISPLIAAGGGLIFLFLQQKRNKPRLFAETMRAFKKQ